MKKLFVISFALAFVVACQTDTRDAHVTLRRVLAPLAGVTVPATTFTVVPETGISYRHPSGSVVDVPANALVYADGSPVQGMAQISYREFHTAADVFASGIPMQYDSAGQTHILQTAGMVEMRAKQGEREVFLAEGKKATVSLACQQAGDYNLYDFDDKTGAWSYKTVLASTAAAPDAAALAEGDAAAARANTTVVLPGKPLALNPDEVAFDFKTNYEDYPELAPYADVKWQYAHIESDSTLDPNAKRWIFGEQWLTAEVSPVEGRKHVFLMRLHSASNEAKMFVRPVFEGKSLAEATAQYNNILQKRDRVAAQLARRGETFAAEEKMVRTFQMASFGIANCDRILKMPDNMQMAASFDFQFGAKDSLVKITTIYQVLPGEKTIIPVSLQAGKGIVTVSAQMRMMLVAILPNNELAIINPEEMRALAAERTKTHTFEMRASGKKIKSMADLQTMLTPS